MTEFARPVPPQVLQEMVAYYRARAAEYDQWWDRQGRYDHGAVANALWMRERDEVYGAFDRMRLKGHILELAPGTGTWTRRIIPTADEVTVVDASPEMLAINREKVPSPKVHYVLANLFEWRPDRQYDAVVFGFWISHVPAERLDDFLRNVAASLHPGAQIFFIDGLREPSGTAADHVLPEETNQVMTRKLNDGREVRIVKTFYSASHLTERCARAGLTVQVRTTPTYFYYGRGTRDKVL
jgi:2-polyprenyl-3-methyl-5-hydroxy-6-metoxy-1,4-benzoquinol methylase